MGLWIGDMPARKNPADLHRTEVFKILLACFFHKIFGQFRTLIFKNKDKVKTI